MIRNSNSKINRKRIYFLFILFLIGFLVIIYKLVSIQYIHASKYKSDADCQHRDEFIINSKRGKILDRNGVELAISLVEKTVYANPRSVADAEYEAETLADVLGLDVEDVKEKLENKELGFVYIKRQVEAEIAELITKLSLHGIYVKDETKRYYPQDELAAPVIGFAGLDNDGLTGIELGYEKYLRGIDGRHLSFRKIYSTLNLVLQSGGALVMKQAAVILDEKLLTKFIKGVDYMMVANVHDEFQIEVKREHAKEIGELARASIIEAGVFFKFHCPLEAEYKIGNNWAQTH